MCLLKNHLPQFLYYSPIKKIKFILKMSLEGKHFNINLILWNCGRCFFKRHL